MLFSSAHSINSIASAVAELPTPAIKGISVSELANAKISALSSLFKVADSPVVPTNTIPSVLASA